MAPSHSPMVTSTDYQRPASSTAHRPVTGDGDDALGRLRAIGIFRLRHGEVPLVAPCRGDTAERQRVVIHRCVDRLHRWQATCFLDGQPQRDLRSQDWNELMEAAVLQERLDPLQARPLQAR